MNIFEALVFAWFALTHPNDRYDDGQPFAVPVRYSLEAVVAADAYANVEPEELIAMLVAESGAASPYDEQARGDGGRSLGLYQLNRRELGEYVDATGDALSSTDLLDATTATRVAAWMVTRHKRVHATRCKSHKHTWIGHWKCGPAARDTRRGCEARRRRLIDTFAAWRNHPLLTWSTHTP